MRVKLEQTLWLVHYPDGTVGLSRPWATKMMTGESVPAMCAFPVIVLPEGADIEIEAPSAAR